MGLIISSTFPFHDFLSFHHPYIATNPTNPGFCQLLQIVQFLCFIVKITFLTLAAAVSDMVGFSLLIH